jgi:hypothetical protein
LWRWPVGREHCLCRPSHDQVYIGACELGCDFCCMVIASFRPSDIDLKVATFDPTEFAEPLHESKEPRASRRGGGTRNPTLRTLSTVCARGRAGQATALTPAMKSRRLIMSKCPPR